MDSEDFLGVLLISAAVTGVAVYFVQRRMTQKLENTAAFRTGKKINGWLEWLGF